MQREMFPKSLFIIIMKFSQHDSPTLKGLVSSKSFLPLCLMGQIFVQFRKWIFLNIQIVVGNDILGLFEYYREIECPLMCELFFLFCPPGFPTGNPLLLISDQPSAVYWSVRPTVCSVVFSLSMSLCVCVYITSSLPRLTPACFVCLSHVLQFECWRLNIGCPSRCALKETLETRLCRGRGWR